MGEMGVQVNNPAFSRLNAARETIPVCLAAVNKGMIRAAAATADGLIGHPVFTRKYITDVVQPVLAGTQCQLYPYVIAAVAESTEQARNEARNQIAFYYTTRLYHSILDVHGWRDAGEAIAAAFRKGDFWQEIADDFNAMVERFNDQPAIEESEEEEPVSVN